MNIPELLASITIAALGVGVATPSLSSMIRSARLDGAARELSVQIRRVRMEAVSRAGYVGIRFEPIAGGGRWRMYADGGTRGIRSSEIASGLDEPIGPAFDLAVLHPGVRLGIEGVGAIPRVPPSQGSLLPGDDPVAFGGSDILSASPTGETSTGTIYLTDGRDLRAIVVYGATGRIRLWSYHAATGRWRS